MRHGVHNQNKATEWRPKSEQVTDLQYYGIERQKFASHVLHILKIRKFFFRSTPQKNDSAVSKSNKYNRK